MAPSFCKHGGWVRLDCSYKMVTQVDSPNLQGDPVTSCNLNLYFWKNYNFPSHIRQRAQRFLQRNQPVGPHRQPCLFALQQLPPSSSCSLKRLCRQLGKFKSLTQMRKLRETSTAFPLCFIFVLLLVFWCIYNILHEWHLLHDMIWNGIIKRTGACYKTLNYKHESINFPLPCSSNCRGSA